VSPRDTIWLNVREPTPFPTFEIISWWKIIKKFTTKIYSARELLPITTISINIYHSLETQLPASSGLLADRRLTTLHSRVRLPKMNIAGVAVLRVKYRYGTLMRHNLNHFMAAFHVGLSCGPDYSGILRACMRAGWKSRLKRGDGANSEQLCAQ